MTTSNKIQEANLAVMTRVMIYRGWLAFLEGDDSQLHRYASWYHFLKHQCRVMLSPEQELDLVEKAQASDIQVSRAMITFAQGLGVFENLKGDFSRTFAIKWGIMAMETMFASWGTDAEYVRELLEIHLIEGPGKQVPDKQLVEVVAWCLQQDWTLGEISARYRLPLSKILNAAKSLV